MLSKSQRPQNYWRNLGFFGLAVLLVAALGLVLGLSWWSAHLYTHPARHPLQGSPADLELDYEAVTFSSADGLLLSGWFIFPAEKAGNGAAIILCHGFGSMRTEMLPEAAILTGHGYSTLLFDFRGHGKSEGDMVTLGYDEVQDVQAAVTYLLTRPDLAPNKIGLLGHSMGGATALRAAAQMPEIRAVITEGAYASLADTLAHDFTNLTGLPRFPFAPLVITLGEWQAGLDIAQVRPMDDIASISPHPVLIIHGLADDVIPPENAQRLYEAAREPKSLWMPEGVGHAASARQQPVEFEARVLSFFEKALLSQP